MNNAVFTNPRQIHITQLLLPSLVTLPIYISRTHVPRPSLVSHKQIWQWLCHIQHCPVFCIKFHQCQACRLITTVHSFGKIVAELSFWHFLRPTVCTGEIQLRNVMPCRHLNWSFLQYNSFPMGKETAQWQQRWRRLLLTFHVLILKYLINYVDILNIMLDIICIRLFCGSL